ncbi:hypothetical protein VCHA53O466_50164 [Vibrio chagasii]|nr:hypothetical protein VCHA53O466_50164 [Vibrio chagasii]
MTNTAKEITKKLTKKKYIKGIRSDDLIQLMEGDSPLYKAVMHLSKDFELSSKLEVSPLINLTIDRAVKLTIKALLEHEISSDLFLLGKDVVITTSNTTGWLKKTTVHSIVKYTMHHNEFYGDIGHYKHLGGSLYSHICNVDGYYGQKTIIANPPSYKASPINALCVTALVMELIAEDVNWKILNEPHTEIDLITQLFAKRSMETCEKLLLKNAKLLSS